jgi:hypothetical protein
MLISLKPVKGFSSSRATHHKSAFHASLHLHSGIYLQGWSSASTGDQLTSLIYIVGLNDSELLTVHRERINLWS